MKNVIAIIIVLTGFSAFGQNHIIGLKSGVNLSNVKGDYSESNNQYKYGYSGGLTYEYHLNNRFQLGLDVIYSQEGFISGIEEGYIGSCSHEREYSYNYNYISFPIKTGVTFGDKFSGFVNLGIIPSVIVNSKIILMEPDFELDNIEDASYSINKFDFGALLEIGASYKFGEKYYLFSSLAYKQGFTQIANSDNTPKIEGTNYGFSLSLGFKYSLN